MLVFFTNLIPFATDKEILIPEKLPGPEFTKIEKSLFKSNTFPVFLGHLSLPAA